MSESNQRRLFVLEEGVGHPFDVALGPGQHDLRDLGVRLDFDGETTRASWLGFGPTAFALPGVRQLRASEALRLQDGDRISWAGRQWRLLRHDLPGTDRAPPRGICRNVGGAGHPLDAVLLLIEGGERGNFLRVRTEAVEWAPGAWLRGRVAPIAEGGEFQPRDQTLVFEVRGAAVELEPGGVEAPANAADAPASANAWRVVPENTVLCARSASGATVRAIVFSPERIAHS